MYRTNTSAFLPDRPANLLLNARRILVVMELTLKDAICTGGHDTPSTLAQATNKHLLLAGQRNVHPARLRADLTQWVCNDTKGQPALVAATSCPRARYTRFAGHWDGVSETEVAPIPRAV